MDVCATCGYYVPHLPDDDEQPGDGTCHFAAPAPRTSTAPEDVATWPSVTNTSFCGQWDGSVTKPA
jgi:hypothetical protein